MVSSFVIVMSRGLAAEASVRLEECVYSCCAEAENDDSNYSIADVSESLLPDLVAETDCLECAPETVAKVKTESYEPYDVDNYHPPVLECLVEEEVRVCSVLTHELLKLHLSPEVVEVECEETKNDDTENEHVLRSPRLSLALASAGVTLKTAASTKVTCSEDECINDVYEETSCENWNHDGHDRKRHEIATSLEKSVCCTICALECVNNREKVDCHVKEKEHDKEKAAYAHDKLLGN